ncbi:MAG: hypothetical protein US94_C0047G0001 [Berkelbacteria bacterium GW2011_GWB1_38_5]|uniref:Uncharacterized protein n=1 Tax=Berkelbacteria bacterium GW2011_GWB1_38_5 TaxID=1618336 RepID=A0A0G0N4E6_9BACT|nr:MAG: hypothetical protein US94_C0047G0001 [Berkelbacteria bacterium GW2011_GWB1_38_5]
MGPTGKVAGKIEGLEANTIQWISDIERWARRDVPSAFHEDFWKELSPEQKARAKDIAVLTLKEVDSAIEWTRRWLQKAVASLWQRQAAGLSLNFKVPHPKGRDWHDDSAAIALTIPELREKFLNIIKGVVEINPETTDIPNPKPSTDAPKDKPVAGKGQKTEPHINAETRTVADCGEDFSNSISEAVNPEVVKKLNGKKSKPTPFQGVIDDLTPVEEASLNMLKVFTPDDLLSHFNADLGKYDNLVNKTNIPKSRLKKAIKKIKQITK